ncbi:MAG: PspC domain-containing protein [Bacteroidales bacterium]|nr:PspC domain-containing protein [Bacteroidales bacterium]MCF8455067.1 PspC domain-containing protein [Bacteroidales bacterium]
MKKTFTINISGIIFHIDEDAYEKLQNYLGLIYKRFSGTDEGKEIIADIEARVAELFNERLKETKQVVCLSDVDEVIETMGDPSEFETEDEPAEEGRKFKSESNYKTGKRLYRDSDNRILGGVSAGIGAYFGVDPVFIRILFIIFGFFQVGIPAYIILWIAVPAARTTAQKLEMRGERVNVSNIERSITEEFNEVKNNFSNFRKSKGYNRTKENLSPLVDAIGSIIRIAGKGILILLGVSFIALGVLVILGFVGSFFSGYWMGFTPFEFDIFSNTGLLTWVADVNNIRIVSIALLLLIGIPILAIIYGGIKLIFRFKANHKLLGVIGLSLWIVGLFMALAAVFMEGSNFKTSSLIRSTYDLKPFNSPVLYIESYPDTLSDYEEYDDLLDMDEVKIVNANDGYQVYIQPKIRIIKTNEDYFQLVEKRSSRGSGRGIAHENAGRIIFNWEQNDSLLTVDNYFTLPLEDKWRNQELELILKMPVGKRIYIDKSMKEIAWNSDYDGDYWPGDLIGTEWQMTSTGLTRARTK